MLDKIAQIYPRTINEAISKIEDLFQNNKNYLRKYFVLFWGCELAPE